jgi:pyridoxal phosphate enzyme (YggS family)
LTESALIADNYLRAVENIQATASSIGRAPDSVRLVVVTKGQPEWKIKAVIAAGARWLGENYVEESLPKMAAIGTIVGVEWHMIGHVQSRKASPVCEHFDWVHSVDSLKLGRRLNRAAVNLNRRLPIILECNMSGEAAKFGWPAATEEGWNELSDQLEPLTKLENLEIRGLMTMPPFSPDPKDARIHFNRLRRLLEYLRSQFPETSWTELSMGMSGDFTVAIEEGATIVRIGTAILGERE